MSLKRGSVLALVHDSARREQLGELLHDAGYSVALAADAHEAEMRLRWPGAPHVLLLDRELDPSELRPFAALLARLPSLSAVPLVVLGPELVESAPGPSGDRLFIPAALHAVLSLVARHCATRTGQRPLWEPIPELTPDDFGAVLS